MALNSREDPFRPLNLAVRSSRLLGIILLAIGILASVAVMFAPAGFPVWAFAIAAGIWLVPGTLYFLFSIFLKRRELWSVVALLVLASIHALLVLIVVVLRSLQIMTGSRPADKIALVVSLLVLAALGQLIYHLVKSHAAIRNSPTRTRGFEPLPVRPISPIR